MKKCTFEGFLKINRKKLIPSRFEFVDNFLSLVFLTTVRNKLAVFFSHFKKSYSYLRRRLRKSSFIIIMSFVLCSQYAQGPVLFFVFYHSKIFENLRFWSGEIMPKRSECHQNQGFAYPRKRPEKYLKSCKK